MTEISSSQVTGVRWCAQVNIVALGLNLAWALAELQDRAVSPSVPWILFLASLLLPYAMIVWLLRIKRLRGALLLGAAWGVLACFAPLSWLVVANTFGRLPAYSVLFFLGLSLLLFPVQVMLAVKARRGYFASEPNTRSVAKLRWTLAGAMLYGVVAGLAGLTSTPGRSVLNPNEPSATATLRTLNTAEITYGDTYKSGFTDNLTRLCSPVQGQQPDANHADLVDLILCGRGPDGTPHTFTKNGYVFTYTPSGKFGDVKEYTLQADPIIRGSTGQRSFYTDQSYIIRANATSRATADDDPL